MASVEAEVRLVDPPRPHLRGDERDGLGAAVGEQHASSVDLEHLGQRRGRPSRIRVATCRVEVAGEHRHRVGCDGVHAGREVEHARGIEPQRRGHALAVAPVLLERCDDT